MVNAFSGYKSPVGASVYGCIAGDAWYRAQYMLQVSSCPQHIPDLQENRCLLGGQGINSPALTFHVLRLFRVLILMKDQKLGHYNHVPPRAVFFSQIFGSFIGVPINYAVIRWVLNSKMDYLNATLTDPNHEWTGQSLVSSLTMATQYVLVVRYKLSST